MQFLINNQTLKVEHNQFSFDKAVIDINDKTQKSLLLMLNSNNVIISKDEMLEHVWLGVIVSDASIFKQIQTLRTLFIQAGLPEDSIENVYGKGYRLKYSVKTSSDVYIDSKTSRTPQFENRQPKIGFKISLFITTAAVIVVYFLWQHQSTLVDKLSEEQMNSITLLSKNNWQQGLDHINQLLAHAKNAYSTADLAYLYQRKGLAEQHLQLIDESLVSLTESLHYYQQQENPDGMGQAHLLLGRLYDYIDNPKKQLHHIQQAISLFNSVGNHTAEIDAYLELAFLQKKAGDIDAAIKTYEQSIATAQQVEDKTGEMIGINNLAATYLIINETDKALALAEQGLAINLASGDGQNTANSYSFLSQLAQQQGDNSRAFKMLEQALKFQLETNSHKNLSAKLMSLNYLLLETHQYKTLDEILSLTEAYAASLRIKGGAAVIDLYQGMLMAYQDQWPMALRELESAWQISTKSNFSYKKPLIMAFLALAQAQNNNHLKAIELANQVLKEKQHSAREVNLANLTLAISYSAMENSEMSRKWVEATEKSSLIQWPIERNIWLQFKRSQLPKDDISSHKSLQQQLAEVQQFMEDLTSKNTFDGDLLLKLKNQINALIEQRSVDSVKAS